jgi:hypothetical protein
MLVALGILYSSQILIARADTLAWWRLSEETPPVFAQEGGPNLKWWSDKDEPYVSSTDIPPETLYRAGLNPAGRSFDSEASNGPKDGNLSAQGLATEEKDSSFSSLENGLTIEGFFKGKSGENGTETQTILSCGDGSVHRVWTVQVIKGYLTFSLFEEGSLDASFRVECPSDVRDEKWHYFVARFETGIGGKSGRASLIVTSSEENQKAADNKTSGEPPKRGDVVDTLLVGRSSIYWDTSPEYRGTIDPFLGKISDIRISRGVLADDQLLGKIVRK